MMMYPFCFLVLYSKTTMINHHFAFWILHWFRASHDWEMRGGGMWRSGASPWPGRHPHRHQYCPQPLLSQIGIPSPLDMAFRLPPPPFSARDRTSWMCLCPMGSWSSELPACQACQRYHTRRQSLCFIGTKTSGENCRLRRGGHHPSTGQAPIPVYLPFALPPLRRPGPHRTPRKHRKLTRRLRVEAEQIVPMASRQQHARASGEAPLYMLVPRRPAHAWHAGFSTASSRVAMYQ